MISRLTSSTALTVLSGLAEALANSPELRMWKVLVMDWTLSSGVPMGDFRFRSRAVLK